MASSGFSFNFGQPASTATASVAPTLNFGAPTGTAPTLNFGASTGSTPSLNFGASAGTAPTLNFGAPTAPATGFSFGAPTQNKGATATTSTSFSLGSLPTSTAGQNTTFNLGTPASTAVSATQPIGFSFGGGDTSAKKNVTFNITSSTATSLPATGQAVNISTGLTSNIQGMTFSELESNINKWETRLEENQRLFLNQMNDLKVKDQLLYKNKEKLEKLNALTEEATAKHQHLDYELNTIGQQQKELDEHLTALEKQLEKIEGDTPVDTERAQTYKLAESLDLQIMKMSDELKEIIENINEQNKCQESPSLVVQIAKILNAQFNALSKLDQKCGELNKDIESINNVQKKL